MCVLEKRIETFAADNRIELKYSWRGKDEDEVNKLFEDYYKELKESVSNRCMDMAEKTITEILHWGGIYRIREDRITDYANKLLSGDLEIDDSTLLSSWTKILAAWDPEKYWIYDSRVAIALAMLFPEYNWFIPVRRNDSIGSYLRKGYIGEEMTKQESYAKYLEFLAAVNKPGSCEKKLFMLGGGITINLARSRHKHRKGK